MDALVPGGGLTSKYGMPVAIFIFLAMVWYSIGI